MAAGMLAPPAELASPTSCRGAAGSSRGEPTVPGSSPPPQRGGRINNNHGNGAENLFCRGPSAADHGAEAAPLLHRGPMEDEFCVGDRVRYWSSTHGTWVDARVQRVNRGGEGCLLSYDLTAKAQVTPSRVRSASTPADAPPPAATAAQSERELQRGKLQGDANSNNKFKIGEQVQYWSESKARWIDAVIEGIYEKDGGAVYDLNCKKGTPGERLRKSLAQYEAGDEVEYYSNTARRWLPAKVLRLQLQLGQCDLDVKPGAPLGRLRKAQAPSALPAGPPGGLAAPDSVAGLGGAPPPPLSCSFRVGDKVQYWSETKARWIEAIVETIRERDGSVIYDLNCKRGTPADRVRPSLLPAQDRLEVGQDVEYWSLSAGRWLQAKVLRVYGPANQCDLDVKLGAPMGRIRAASGDARAMSPEPHRLADDVPKAQPEPDAPPAAPAPARPEPEPLEATQEQQARETPAAGEAEGAEEEPEAASGPMEPAPAAAAPAPRPVLPLPLAPRTGMAMVKTASLLAPLPTLSLGLGGGLPGGGGGAGSGGGLDLPKAADLFAAAAAQQRRPGPLLERGFRSRSREQERRERSRSRTARAC